MVSAFITTEDFTKYCRQVYFATEDFSLVTFIIVNGGLYYLLLEKHILEEDETAAAGFLSYQNLCQDNLKTALANLPLFLPARIDSIQALLLGVRASPPSPKPLLIRVTLQANPTRA